jgi:pullulanase
MKQTFSALLILILLVFTPLRNSNLYAANESVAPVPYEEMVYTPTGTTFTLWSPTATQVRINLYKDGRGGEPYQEVQLKEDHGFWKMHLPSDLKGVFYTFRILYKGVLLDETPGIQSPAVGVNGNRGAILDMKQTNPQGWDSDVRPEAEPYTDMLLYELNLRDFSMGKQSGMVNKGKYLALTETGSTNSNAFSTGLDHLIDFGVTHVLLMPVFDFYTDDESRPKEVIRSWNYQPLNYCVPEGLFSTRPFDPISRILEFKQMVQALHKAGIRVVMDMDFSHTAKLRESSFSLILPGLCYRLKPDGSPSNASGYGNELATEQPFLRQYILQTLLYWIKEYHVDGFRLDQTGVMDIETINQIRKVIDAIDPSIFICGDGVAVNASPLSELDRGLASNTKLMPGIAQFDAVWEDALKGSPTDSTESGFIQGKPDLEEFIRYGIVGGIRHPQVNTAGSPGFMVNYAASPKEVIQYASSHVGFTLFDQIEAVGGHKETMQQVSRRAKLANSIVMTSQGIPFVFSGEELMRSRGGISNNAATPDSICRIDWKNKTYYNDMYEFCRGMVELRKQHPAFRMASAQQIQKNLHFLNTSEKCVVAYILEPHLNGDSWNKIVVIHNSNNHPVSVQVPAGKWTIVVQDGKVDALGISEFNGEQASVPPVSTLVAYQ